MSLRGGLKAMTLCWALSSAAGGASAQSVQPESIRIALIGLDNPNAELFTQRLNDPADPSHVSGGRIVAAFPGEGFEDEGVNSRIQAVTAVLRDKYGVRIAESVDDAISKVDAVLLLSTDPRFRLDQATAVIASGKPFFVSKPVAASLKQVVEIFKLAEVANTPVFSASPLRWSAGISELALVNSGAPPSGVLAFGNAPAFSDRSSMFGETIHLVEALTTLMGPGCVQVTNVASPPFATVVGVWPDGRMGTLMLRHDGAPSFRMTRFDGDISAVQTLLSDPTPLLREIVKFFQTRQAPVSRLQSLGVYALAEAAEESGRNKGAPTSIEQVLKKAGAPVEWFAPPPAEPAAAE